MEFDILYAIQNLHCTFMDTVVLGLTKLLGDYGQLWIFIGAIMLFFKKSRKCGIAILISYALVFLVGHVVLKDLIARERPYIVDKTISLLIERKTSYSCPSTHTAWSFAAATSIFKYYKKIGIIAFVVAGFVGFSRMYLFAHFPTDVLLGVVLGIAFGILSAVFVNRVIYKKEKIMVSDN